MYFENGDIFRVANLFPVIPMVKLMRCPNMSVMVFKLEVVAENRPIE